MVNAAGKQIEALSLALAILLISCLASQAMELTSSAFANDSHLPVAQVHTRCGGGNRSPALHWSGAPPNTRSFALTLFDPDAGGGAGFWHWLVFDISAGTSGLPESAGGGTGLPSGAMQAANDFGETGYGGACPPPGSGIHHYQFTLYALGASQIPFGPNANGAALSAYLKEHALASASLVTTYAR
jgi:Raf kinase inhibitor-like YbhB/YbcL family protein